MSHDSERSKQLIDETDRHTLTATQAEIALRNQLQSAEDRVVVLGNELEDAWRESAALRHHMDTKIEDFLNGYACCNGQDCGCMGVSRLQQYVAEECAASSRRSATSGQTEAKPCE